MLLVHFFLPLINSLHWSIASIVLFWHFQVCVWQTAEGSSWGWGWWHVWLDRWFGQQSWTRSRPAGLNSIRRPEGFWRSFLWGKRCACLMLIKAEFTDCASFGYHWASERFVKSGHHWWFPLEGRLLYTLLDPNRLNRITSRWRDLQERQRMLGSRGLARGQDQQENLKWNEGWPGIWHIIKCFIMLSSIQQRSQAGIAHLQSCHLRSPPCHDALSVSKIGQGKNALKYASEGTNLPNVFGTFWERMPGRS